MEWATKFGSRLSISLRNIESVFLYLTRVVIGTYISFLQTSNQIYAVAKYWVRRVLPNRMYKTWDLSNDLQPPPNHRPLSGAEYHREMTCPFHTPIIIRNQNSRINDEGRTTSFVELWASPPASTGFHLKVLAQGKGGDYLPSKIWRSRETSRQPAMSCLKIIKVASVWLCWVMGGGD